MKYRMKINSTKPVQTTIRTEDGRSVEILGFTGEREPQGAIVRYLDTNRRGRVSDPKQTRLSMLEEMLILHDLIRKRPNKEQFKINIDKEYEYLLAEYKKITGRDWNAEIKKEPSPEI